MDVIYLASTVIISVVFVIYLLIRVGLYLLSWYLSRKYSVKFKTNRVGIFAIKGIFINLYSLMNIEIESITVSSRLFNNKFNSLIVFKLSGVRFQGNFIKLLQELNSNSSNSSFEAKLTKFSNLLKSLSKFRFISFCLQNTSLMQFGLTTSNGTDECLVHTTLQTLISSLGHRSNQKTSILTFRIDGVSLKVLRHSNDSGETCLAHLSLAVVCHLHVHDTNELSFEMSILHPQIILYQMPLLNISNDSFTPEVEADNLVEKKLITKLKSLFIKHVSLKIKNVSMKLVREKGQKAFGINITSIEADLTKTCTPELDARLMINSLHILTTNSVLASLHRANFICKVEQEKSLHQSLQLFLLTEMSSCHLIYSEEEILYWFNLINTFTLEKQKPEVENEISCDENKKALPELLKDEITKLIFSFDINDISMTVKPNNTLSPVITYGLNHNKINWALNSDPILKEMSFDVLLETLWCWKGDKQLRPANPNSWKKYHQKQVPLFMKMLLVKCRYINMNDIRFQLVMDDLQASLDHFIKFLNQYNFDKLKSSESESKSNTSFRKYLSSTSLQINLSSINLFTSDLMLRLDSSSIDSNGTKLTSSINGLAVTGMTSPSTTLTSLKAAELTRNRIIYFSVVRVKCNHYINEVCISITEEIFIQWNASFHLTLLELYEEISQKFQNRKSNIPMIQHSLSVNLKLEGKINIGALLSNKGNSMNFQTENLTFNFDNKICLKTNSIAVNFDDHSIMKLEDLCILFLPESESQTVINRKNFQNPYLEVKKNRILSIVVENVLIKFPYNYNFAEVFNEKFITIIKWLKIVHKKENQSSELKQNIPFDMKFKIHNGIMEIEDDPFEVKLNNNYELLEDEYSESTKRWQMLLEKIEEKKKNYLLSSAKLKELQEAYAKQNVKIYVERSKKLYSNTSLRTCLFTVAIEGLELEVAADSSYSSYDQMVSVMKRIDKESPFPDDLKFSTIWCRRINGSILNSKVTLRDFPKPMMDIKDLLIRGTVIGAEQEASNRAIRTCYVDVGPNYQSIPVKRSMTTLKLYHDLVTEASTLAYTHGVCWEPVLQQLNLSFELISKPSLDPSPSLSWWDKMRFLFHGSLTIITENLSLFFHASLDPYNSTELVEIAANKSLIDWLTGKINFKGGLGLLVHTESCYDECRIVDLPSVNICINLNWLCKGNKNDHHSVMPCAPDKIPEYSSNQIHDSYRSFRSHNLNVTASLDTKPLFRGTNEEIPSVVIYNSTLNWLENKTFMVAGLVRLTRKGKLFGNTKPIRQPFGRIFKSIRVAISLHEFKVSYWTSNEKHIGCEIISSNLSHSAEHILSLVSPNDGYIHRPKPVWDMSYMNTEFSDVEMSLYRRKDIDHSVLQEQDLEKQFFLNIKTVSYNRETKANINPDNDEPIHRLVIHDLKGAWTKDNRDVAFGLFDNYMKAQLLKRNLSTDALKTFKVDAHSTSPVKNLKPDTTSPLSTISKSHAASMLQKLIAEAETSSIVYTEDIENAVSTETPQLHGVAACQTNDIIHKNWMIELVNSQVMLRGCETDGYVIVSAAKAQILQSIHRPVWKNRTLYAKTTWKGSLECMQYYATVDAGGLQNDNVVWLTVDNIEERDNMVISNIPDLVGSGHSVGGVVGSEVGNNDLTNSCSQVQLQRIVSRCRCQFFYASYDENFSDENLSEAPPVPEDDDLLSLEPWDREVAVDSFTLTHHDLEISTNSQQFAMIVDLVNNLLLYVEPHKKEAYEQEQRIRFAMQLSSIEDQREPISRLQDRLRFLVSKLARLEKEAYAIRREIAEESNSQLEERLVDDLQRIEHETDLCKKEINHASDDLTLMINCFKEAQISANKTRERLAAIQEAGGTFIANVIRRSEVCFKHAIWRLTDSDGQLGLADLVLSNFLYTKIAKNDDSVEHSFELGYIHASNLMPNQVYKDILLPTELQPNIPLDRHRALRIFCRERAPVGGIPIKEHLEINVIPFTIGLTYVFFKTMLKFFFDREAQSNSNESEETNSKIAKKRGNARRERERERDDNIMSSSLTLASTNSKNSKNSNLSTGINSTNSDNIEKMRRRAQKNHSFVYIKIPEVPIRISYKGNKGIDDFHNVSLIIPTLEYHNRTWTWLDLLMELKKDSRRVLLSQALKQKFHISLKNRITSNTESESSKQAEDDEEDKDRDKARMLLGNLAVPTPNKSSKSSKGLSLFSHKK